MGNAESSPSKLPGGSFPGATLLDNIQCGAIDDTDDTAAKQHFGGSPNKGSSKAAGFQKLFNHAEMMCAQSPNSEDGKAFHNHNEDDEFFDQSEPVRSRSNNDDYIRDPTSTPTSSSGNPTSALFARALVSEVTDNPKTMTPSAMAEREKRLLKAQDRAKEAVSRADGPRPVGAPGGIGKPSLLGSIAHALTGNADIGGNPTAGNGPKSSIVPPSMMQESRAQAATDTDRPASKYSITIGLSLSRRHATLGHPDTVTRQTAFDFNELQDRQYKYVSSTDSSGWRAGGGERGGQHSASSSIHTGGDDDGMLDEFGIASLNNGLPGGRTTQQNQNQYQSQTNAKIPAADTVHIPIIHIDAQSQHDVDQIIAALARGEVFIPHMAVLPEALSVNGISPPDLVVRFGCERNEDVPPDEWPNWCLEFMHNQLYEYFMNMGARWTKRPFSITLARKVRWKTVKHMNRYFAHAERVIDAWREKGPQYLDPQLAYIEGGATPEEVAKPHGIYLLRNGVPTNYFAPNFDPPYTTKMTRSLLLNVLGKSWDKKRREWTSTPIPRLVTPSVLLSSMCGCTDPSATGGFMANEVTLTSGIDTSTIPSDALISSPSNPPELLNEQPDASVVDESYRSTTNTEVAVADPVDRERGSEANTSVRPASRHDTIAEQYEQHSDEEDDDGETMSMSDQNAYQSDESSTKFNDDDDDEEEENEEEEEDMEEDEDDDDDDKQYSEMSSMSNGIIPPVEDDETESRTKDLEDSIATSSVPAGGSQSHDPPTSAASSDYEDELKEFFSTSGEDESASPVKSKSATKVSKSYSGHSVSSQDRTKEERSARPEPPTNRTPKSSINISAEKAPIERGGDPDGPIGGGGGDDADLATESIQPGAAEPVPPSVAGSNSTVMHMNLSAEKIMKRDLERRQAREEKKEEEVRAAATAAAARRVSEVSASANLACDEDWLVDMAQPSEVKALQPLPAAFSAPTQPSAPWKRRKERREKDRLAVERERSRQIAMIAMASQDENARNHDSITPLRGPPKLDFGQTVIRADGTRVISKGIDTPGKRVVPAVTRNDSGMSLEYSVDSTFVGDASTLGGSTLAGQQFATDGSVTTTTSRGSVRRHHQQQQQQQQKYSSSSRKDDDELASSFSLQESTSSMDLVPTDEELFAVGWAKALDPNSGSYYYFTLDRSKIVWDNPLASAGAASASSAESSLPTRTI